MNLFKLAKHCTTEVKALKYCQRMKLLPKYVRCPSCKKTLNSVFKIRRSGRSTICYRFRCNKSKCRRTGKDSVPLKKGTFFENSNLSLRKTLFIIYSYVLKLSYQNAIRESSISESDDDDTTVYNERKIIRKSTQCSKKTVARVYNKCRDMCVESVLRRTRNKKIGGTTCVVQVDEAKFGKQKYHKGRKVQGQWVLGGICDNTGDMFLRPVKKRDKSTLLPILQECIAEGSTVITDEWKAYKSLPELGFHHLTVNHSKNFVNPKTGAHTQLIENQWWCIKRQLPTTHTKKYILYKHLLEYMWRRHLTMKKLDMFEEILKDISKTFKMRH